MGTNYYLMQKTKFNPMVDKVESVYLRAGIPIRLTNGWVYNNKYYATVENLNDDYEVKLHIGKSSYGWKFLLCAYPELDIMSLEDWEDLSKKPGNRIINEYGEDISLDELKDTILNRVTPDGGFSTRNSNTHSIIKSKDTYEITTFTEFS